MTCEACGEEHDPDIMVAVEPDPTTLLPVVVLGLPSPEKDADGNVVFLRAAMDTREAFDLGSYLVQASMAAARLEHELAQKGLDERQEIMDLYASYSAPEAPEPNA